MPKPPIKGFSLDDYQTPPEALLPLLPYLKKDWVIWECADGQGRLTRGLREHGYQTIGTDILTGQDFLKWSPESFDCIVTNPPFSVKQKFLVRAYSLGKPFAFLLPLTTLETRARQKLFIKHGLEIILFDKRINFSRFAGEITKNWFATAWFTNGLDLGQQLTFVSLIEKQQGILF